MTVEEKKERIDKLRKYHEPAFLQINVKDPLYIPRMAYKPKGLNEVTISLFKSELKQERDIYTEFVSKNYVSEDPNRVLYKWKYNPFWENEYAHSDDPIPSSVMYYIPTSELIVISRNGEVKADKIEVAPNTPKITTDLSGMLKKKESLTEKDAIQINVLDVPVKDITLRHLREILNKL